MSNATEELPDDLASALALLAQERARRVAAEAEAATAKAEAASAKALVSHSEALIARLKLEIDRRATRPFRSRLRHATKFWYGRHLPLNCIRHGVSRSHVQSCRLTVKTSPTQQERYLPDQIDDA